MPYKTRGLFEFMRNQPTQLDIPTTDLTGRVVIVTGSNSGVGLEAARQLAQMSPDRLILAVRRPNAGREAATSIAASSNVRVKPEVWTLDMASFASVRAFAARCDQELARLDIFVANAGMSSPTYKQTGDGIEAITQVNTLSTTLLACLIAPILARTATLPALAKSPSFKPHLTIVTSYVHYLVADLPGLNDGTVFQYANNPKNFNGIGSTYRTSKLILMLNIPAIAAKAGPSVLVTAVDPGHVATNITRELKGVMVFVVGVLNKMYARSPEDGAKPLVWASVAPLPSSGLYSSSCKITKPSEMVMSDKDGSKNTAVWREMQVIWKEKAGIDVPL
ncbi:hypothetical protein BCR39DRAFT_585518 [Naematelia encephala]|uniref:Uncharacterized protein n=1 Tax=Naematelia encephala TaxID=71784 RepID=A0A1Y2BIC0_9TREE|nr:hypothetical protein BCR39DRAFT_585518 [Naematelia encephala]